MKRELNLNAVDELGAIRAQIADLKKIEEQLSSQVKELILINDGGDNAVEGVLFRAVLAIAERTTLDSKAAAAILPIETYPDLYRHTVTESLRLSARKSS